MKKVIFLNASDEVKKETGSTVAMNVYMLGYACSKKLIPLKKEFLLEGLGEVVPEKFFEMNKKLFEMGGIS